ncbi:MAG: serine/threonine protein kinase [Deltaproteobacteria bacterium]|nr:MAG: serine/threonine protein kinase [Deltaproteobacteria bacterium]
MSIEAPTKTLPAPPPVPAARSLRGDVDVGTVLGRYRLLHRLGHGGMAVVFLGRKVGAAGFEKLAAIKVIHPHLAEEPDFVEMFLDEARIAAKLHHPHVVQILDLGEAGGRYFMVMEYVEGDTVASLLAALTESGERLPVAAALQIVADAASGLSAAHALVDSEGRTLRLVHRDVSPQNLLVSLDGWVKVVDFGIAKAAGRRSTTLTGQLRGKVPYMAPEQARGEDLDARTDIFALGAVLWELVAARRLFTGKTETAVLEKVLACDVPRPEGIDDDVWAILQRALAADRADRYADADEMRRDVLAALRRICPDDDPRRILADVTRKALGDKVRYLRSQVAASSGRFSDVDLRHDEVVTTPSTTNAAVAPSASIPPERRRRILWWTLPLVGAAAAAVFLAMTDRAPAGADGKERAEPPPPAQAPQAQVPVTINTDPQGAELVVAGDPHPRRTPATLLLPRSSQPVTVELSLPGYLPRTVQVVPATAGTYDFVLRPLVPRRDGSEPGSKPPTLTAKRPSPRKGPRKGRGGERDAAKDEGAGSGDTAKPPDADGSRTEPQLAPMPDFERLAKQPHPAPKKDGGT